MLTIEVVMDCVYWFGHNALHIHMHGVPQIPDNPTVAAAAVTNLMGGGGRLRLRQPAAPALMEAMRADRFGRVRGLGSAPRVGRVPPGGLPCRRSPFWSWYTSRG